MLERDRKKKMNHMKGQHDSLETNHKMTNKKQVQHGSLGLGHKMPVVAEIIFVKQTLKILMFLFSPCKLSMMELNMLEQSMLELSMIHTRQLAANERKFYENYL